MEPARLTAFFQQVGEIDAAAVLAAALEDEAARPKYTYEINNGVAIFPITGIILKDVPWFYEWLGITATSTLDVQEALDRALDDDAVRAILLHIDSPGGTVAGGQELADALHMGAHIKPIHAHISDIGCSAAYELASQAGRISANRTAMVGCIGTYAVVWDESEAAAKAGITVHVIKSGEHKGDFTEGTEVTQGQLDAEQKLIEGMAVDFVAAVARGRGLAVGYVRGLATGETWLAKEAQAIGLIDSVENFHEALKGAATSVEERVMPGTGTMTPEALRDQFGDAVKAIEDAAATRATEQAEAKMQDAERQRFAALQKLGSDRPDFVAEAFLRGDTVHEAKAALADVLLKENRELREAKAEAEERAAEAEKTPTGTHSDRDMTPAEKAKAAAAAGGPKTYMEALEQECKERGIDFNDRRARSQIARDVRVKYPDLT